MCFSNFDLAGAAARQSPLPDAPLMVGNKNKVLHSSSFPPLRTYSASCVSVPSGVRNLNVVKWVSNMDRAAICTDIQETVVTEERTRNLRRFSFISCINF
jgi:hypothetical protein